MITEWLEAKYTNPQTEPFFDASGVLNVFSKEDVGRVLTDKVFGSAPLYEGLRYKSLFFGGMWALDGKAHRMHKSLINSPFRTNREGFVRNVVSQTLFGVRGVFDIVPLSLQISGEVICSILGIDKVMVPQFVEWLKEPVAAASTTQLSQPPAVEQYMRELLAERRQHPQHALVDEVIAAASDDFSDWDMLSYLFVFIAAGVETTATGIANMLVLLVKHGCWETLLYNRALIPTAVEACLRERPSFPAILRSVLHPCQLSGHELKEGARVLAWVSAAHGNDEPFDITREQNQHFAFGGGVHTCYGAPLARLEMCVTLETLLEKFAHLYLVAPVVYHGGVVVGPAKAEFEGSSDEK